MTVFGLTLGEAVTIATIAVGTIGWFVRLQMSSRQNAVEASEALRVAREARDLVHAVRLDIAKEYASTGHLKEVEGRLAVAIEHLTERIDKVLDRMGS